MPFFQCCLIVHCFIPMSENAALKAKLECSQQLIERIETEQQQLRTALHHAVKEVSELKNRSRIAGAEAVQVDTTFLLTLSPVLPSSCDFHIGQGLLCYYSFSAYHFLRFDFYSDLFCRMCSILVTLRCTLWTSYDRSSGSSGNRC
jgi:hypothetical protein